MAPLHPTTGCTCAATTRVRWWHVLPAVHAGGKIIAAVAAWTTDRISPLID